ncbi:hypothetical protein K402DRAFT_300195, partial [Aulographum hederae CBS 113979]
CSHCGALFWIEERIRSSSKINPRFNCCADGSIVLPPILPPPQELSDLFTATEIRTGRVCRTEESERFHRAIRYYNDAFSFCSIGVQIDRELAQQLRGGYTFRAHGAFYHRIGALQPEHKPAAYAQLYIFDTEDEQLTHRSIAFRNLDPNISRMIQRVLHEYHPFVQAFQNNAERIRTDNSITLRLGIVEDATKDPRVYNRPTASEVAALIPTTGAGDGARHIMLQRFGDSAKEFLNEQRQEYLTLRYPFLYPRGELGWHYTFPRSGHVWRDAPLRLGRNGSTRVSQQQWFKHHLQVRPQSSHILNAGRLLQELVVDAFVSICRSRLDYFRHNQQEMRLSSYGGLMDALDANDAVGTDVGKSIILPASFTGSPRQMRNAYLDAMAIARHHGPPDFFITFTCNP